MTVSSSFGRRHVVAMALAAACALPVCARTSKPGEYSGFSDERFEGFVLNSQYVAAQDGTRLAVDIYRPANAGKAADEKLPVVLIHYTSPRRDPDPSKLSA